MFSNVVLLTAIQPSNLTFCHTENIVRASTGTILVTLMTLQQIQESIKQLSFAERMTLLGYLTRSLEKDFALQTQNTNKSTRRMAAQEMKGFLKQPGKSALTDESIDAMKEAYLTEKYMQ